MLKRFEDNNYLQYFFDFTYKCEHITNDKNKLGICVGYNSLLKIYNICFMVLTNCEVKETLMRIFHNIKFYSKFDPQIMTPDFSMANLNSIKLSFKKSKLITCFFPFVQAQ